MAQSSAYIKVMETGEEIHFSGVIQIRLSFSSKVNQDAESGADVVNGARVQPNKVILSIVETDVGNGAGWASRMLKTLKAIQRERKLCRVATDSCVLESMILADFSTVQDDTSQGGWSASLTFQEFSTAYAAVKTNNNSSSASGGGYASSAYGMSYGGSGGTPFGNLKKIEQPTAAELSAYCRSQLGVG